MNPVTALAAPLTPSSPAPLLHGAHIDGELRVACLCNACTYACLLARWLLFWQRSDWNRVTLRLIRKLMHRKSRQRHCSPSARGAGENNLHIGRLMDAFIGCTGRGDGGCNREGEKRRGLVIGPGRGGPVTLITRPNQTAAYQITHNHRGSGTNECGRGPPERAFARAKDTCKQFGRVKHGNNMLIQQVMRSPR